MILWKYLLQDNKELVWKLVGRNDYTELVVCETLLVSLCQANYSKPPGVLQII